MAAPTQVFPPWLTPVPVTTEVNGIPAVETSIEFIPLTYFGPSIPLGTVFTFGGSTFPPTVVFGPQSTSTPTPISTSSSSSTSTSQSSTTSPSTSATSASTTTSSTRATSSASQSTQPVSASVNSHGLSTATKLAIGLSIGIIVLLLLVLLAVFLRVRRRRALRSINRFSDSDWQIVGSPDVNEDATRGTGESEVLLPEERVMRQRASLSSTPALTPWMRTAYEPVASAATEPVPRNSENSARSTGWSTSQPSGSRSTIAPSSLFFNPAKSRGEGAKQVEEKNNTSRDGSSSLAGDPSSSPSDGSRNYAILPAGASPPLFPPRSYRSYQAPASDDDEYIPSTVMFTSPPRLRSRHHSTDSLPYPESPPSETDERATLLTAQRVELGPQVTATSISPQERTRSLSPEQRPESSGLGTSLAGLTRLTGLNRFSWFRRMENQPSGYRHSSPPLSPTDEIHRTSSFNRLSFHPGSRPHSGILYPGYGSRPMSDVSYSGLADNELGLRPPTLYVSTGGSTGSYSRSGNGSGSGRTTYHSALSRPGSFYPPPVPQLRSPLGEGELIDLRDTFPGLDTVTAQDTIRPIDVLDMPVPEPTLPLQAALSPDNVVSRSSSRGSPHFPPGLVAVPRWNSATTSNQEVDVLDQAPPRSPGEWSSMKSKQASSDSPVQRVADVEHNVEVTSAQGPISEEGIIETGRPFSPGSPNALGFSLTPRVSLYAPSEHVSRNSGSHSSRPSDHTTFSGETHGSYNDALSDDEYRPSGIQRASLSAIGGHDSSGRIHHVRRRPSTVAGRVLPAPEERTSEEERSGGGSSRPVSIASAGSRPTVSETVVSRTPTSGQAFDSIGKVGGQEVASIINVLQSSEQHSADNL